MFLSYFSGHAQIDSLSMRIQVYQLSQIIFHFDKPEPLVNEQVNSKDSLNYLLQILLDNPTIIVEIRNHTDCRGSDKYSVRLSQKRAQTVVNYLITKGVNSKRLIAKGMEDSEPLPGLSCEEITLMKNQREKELAHKKNRRTDFKVVSWDFVE